MILWQLDYGLRTLNTLSLVTDHPNYRVSIYLGVPPSSWTCAYQCFEAASITIKVCKDYAFKNENRETGILTIPWFSVNFVQYFFCTVRNVTFSDQTNMSKLFRQKNDTESSSLLLKSVYFLSFLLLIVITEDGRSKHLFHANLFHVYFCLFGLKSNFKFAKLGRFHFF